MQDGPRELPTWLSTTVVARLFELDPSTIRRQWANGIRPGSLGQRVGRQIKFASVSIVNELEASFTRAQAEELIWREVKREEEDDDGT